MTKKMIGRPVAIVIILLLHRATSMKHEADREPRVPGLVGLSVSHAVTPLHCRLCAWTKITGTRGNEPLPKIGSEGILMQIVLPIRCHVLIFQAPNYLHYMTLPEHSLFPKSTSSTSTNSPLQAENSPFFWRGHGQKYRSECTKTRHFK